MAIFRTKNEAEFKNYGKFREKKVTIPDEWTADHSKNRIKNKGWIERYETECEYISDIIKEEGYGKIIELGSGPGTLGQYIMKEVPEIEYTFIDKKGAYDLYKKEGYKGKFIVKDLMNEFDISDLDNDYDMIIANDFLEHIANPSDVMYKSRKIVKDAGRFFISVPNWRMNHTFIYRGLFDYDNFIYFCYVHGWEAEKVYRSNLQCEHKEKLDSESHMPDMLITSWNWYFNMKKIEE